MKTIIDQQYENGKALVNYLILQNQITFQGEAENNFRKMLLISSASFFEKEIADIIIEFVKTHTENDERIISIIKQKAISRQYHTYFDWSKPNANSFFALFGEDFKNKMVEKVKKEAKLEKSIKAFLEMGQERNKMVHQNFAEIVIDKTAEEIYELYKCAIYFVQTIKKELTKQEKIETEIPSSVRW